MICRSSMLQLKVYDPHHKRGLCRRWAGLTQFLSSWFCHLDNSSGGRKLLDFCTYRSDGIQFPYGIAMNIGMFSDSFDNLQAAILCEAEGASSFTFV